MGISQADYQQSMSIELMDIEGEKIQVQAKMETQKKQVAKSYNKKVKHEIFLDEDLVWKMKLLEHDYKDHIFDKWSSKWEGPFRVHKDMSGNAYLLQELDGEMFPRALNGKFLKQYNPSIWEQYKNLQQKHPS
ncbi:uncharacterized protein LOC110737487 [Chenopodium quinoa]|uniref:uncharacterized protein LOC110737487 n=1 Tax=Chenopodium quinoa TaxID=63459 RepID=UPI000B76C424|nr:uncharacterized protein LOC110737487 [Chenopodium quinoa]